MTYIDQEPWPEPPLAADEATAIVAALERQRATLAWKTGGLEADGLRATAAASTITLGGLLKHLALVEDQRTAVFLTGEPIGPPWDAVDFEADPDWAWRSAADDSPAELYRLWRDAVERSRAATARVLADGGLDQPSRFTTPSGEHPNLRRVLVDQIEEYIRHTGHADLLREAVDGLVGEDPPQP
jgi:Protein of unknown function (DUF664)